MQIVFIQIGFAKFNKFAPALAQKKEKETNDQKKKEKVVINSTFEMVYEKNEGACKKHIHLSNGFQAEQSIGVLQQQFFAFRRSVLFWRVSEHKWMEVAGSAFTDTQCRDRSSIWLWTRAGLWTGPLSGISKFSGCITMNILKRNLFLRWQT